MQGKWWSFGGRSKKFDASNADFSIIWYPGKHNTITFKGQIGEQAQEHLIKCCMLSPTSDSVEHNVNRKCSCSDSEEGRENLFLEIEILKSQVDCLQSLLSFQNDSFNSVGDIINKITRLEIDLEEEKLRNRCLELDVKRLRDEVMSRNSHRDGLVHSTEATDLDKSQYTGEHMTNNEFGNAQNEIMLTNSHCDGLVYLNEKIDLNKSQCINDDTTDLNRDGLVNTKEEIVVDKFNYINGHTGNKEFLNVKENSHLNVIQQPYNNSHMINTKVRIEDENNDQLPFNPNNKRKCTNDQSEAAERINEQIQEFRRKQSRVFAYKSSRMSCHDEYPSRDISFARQLKEYTNKHRAKQHQSRQMSPVESRPNPSLGRKFSKKNQNSFFRITALHDRNNTWKHYLNLVSTLTRPPPCQAQLQVTLV